MMLANHGNNAHITHIITLTGLGLTESLLCPHAWSCRGIVSLFKKKSQDSSYSNSKYHTRNMCAIKMQFSLS